MRRLTVAIAAAVFLTGGVSAANAQFMKLIGAGTIVIKSHETIELGELYWVSQCRSLLKSPPQVEVLEGPDQIEVAVKESMVLPRLQSCAKKIPGGILVITAKDIDDPSFTRLAIRVHYKTKDGDRKWGHVFNLQLVP